MTKLRSWTGSTVRQIGQEGVSATGNFPNTRDSIKPPLLMETARVIPPKKFNSRFQNAPEPICQMVFLQFQFVFVECCVTYFRSFGACFRVSPLALYVYCTLARPGARKSQRLVCKISKSLRAAFCPTRFCTLSWLDINRIDKML